MKTPYLYLDYDQMMENLRDIADLAQKNGTILRPHCKSHKSPEIARLQMSFGASGMTASTLKEVRMLQEAGIPSVTLAYPLVDKERVEEFCALRNHLELRTIVCSKNHGETLNQWFEGREPAVVYLKVDSGLGRLGVNPKEVSTLLSYLKSLPNLRIIGLLTHGGHSYFGTKPLKEVAREEADSLLQDDTRSQDKEWIHSCGSTPTIRHLLTIPEVNEARPGNYVFYDRTMIQLGVARKEQVSLLMKSTVLDVRKEVMIIDAGSKALSSDTGVHGNRNLTGYGLILEDETLVLDHLSEEHGFVKGSGIKKFAPGDILTIIPNHACTMVNLFDEIALFKDGKHIKNYKILGRGHD